MRIKSLSVNVGLHSYFLESVASKVAKQPPLVLGLLKFVCFILAQSFTSTYERHVYHILLICLQVTNLSSYMLHIYSLLASSTVFYHVLTQSPQSKANMPSLMALV